MTGTAGTAAPGCRRRAVACLPLSAVLLGGCAGWLAPEVDGKPAPPPQARAPRTPRPPPGLDARGEVIAPDDVARGSGRAVVGVDGWKGEVHGTPPPGSRLAALQVGMRMPAVVALAGAPSDQGAHARDQPWLPSLLGTTVYRHQLLYRGEGRLVFAGGGPGDHGESRLVWIIHSAAETGYAAGSR